MDGEKKKLRFSLGYLIVAFWAVLLLQQVFSAYLQPTRTSYSDFKAAVDSGRVTDVAIGHTLIRGHMKGEPQAANNQQVANNPQAAHNQPQEAAKSAQLGAFETVRVDDPDLMHSLATHSV